MGRDVTGYNGLITGIEMHPATGGGTVRVAVGSETWIVTNLSGPFLNEIATSGPLGLQGRNVRIYMVNGQPEIAYTT
jgi:hypothetical protein